MLTIFANNLISGVQKSKPFSPFSFKVRINVLYSMFTFSATSEVFLDKFSNFHEMF